MQGGMQQLWTREVMLAGYRKPVWCHACRSSAGTSHALAILLLLYLTARTG